MEILELNWKTKSSRNIIPIPKYRINEILHYLEHIEIRIMKDKYWYPRLKAMIRRIYNATDHDKQLFLSWRQLKYFKNYYYFHKEYITAEYIESKNEQTKLEKFRKTKRWHTRVRP